MGEAAGTCIGYREGNAASVDEREIGHRDQRKGVGYDLSESIAGCVVRICSCILCCRVKGGKRILRHETRSPGFPPFPRWALDPRDAGGGGASFQKFGGAQEVNIYIYIYEIGHIQLFQLFQTFGVPHELKLLKYLKSLLCWL